MNARQIKIGRGEGGNRGRGDRGQAEILRRRQWDIGRVEKRYLLLLFPDDPDSYLDADFRRKISAYQCEPQ